jgi:myosin heavy subunit
MNVKSSPAKDVKTTKRLGVRSAHMLKRNEQGMWQGRFVCMVPHMFLYYYGDEEYDVPRGIIDLEYYTTLTVDGDVVSLHPPQGNPHRSFHLKIEDDAVRSDWVAGIKRDRFRAVQDERDMYQELQEAFSGQINTMTKTIETYNQEKEELLRDVAESRKVSEDAMVTLYRLVALLDVETEESVSGDITVLGNCLDREIKQLMTNHIKFLDDSSKARDVELGELRLKVESMEQSNEKLERRLATESVTLESAERRLSQEKEDAEVRYRNVHAQLEDASASLQAAVSEKQDGQEKVAGLNSQKKLLIKEVKSLRKKDEESVASMQSLEEQLNTLRKDNERLVQENKKLLEQIPSSSEENIDFPLSSDSSLATAAVAAAEATEAAAVTAAAAAAAVTTTTGSGGRGVGAEEQEKSLGGEVNGTTAEAAIDQKQAPSKRGSIVATLGSVFKFNGKAAETGSRAAAISEMETISEPLTGSDEDGQRPEGADKGFVLSCYRCSGTVEGPKYSTCKCAEPALTPEDVTSKPTSRKMSDKLFSSMLGRNKNNKDNKDVPY